MRWEACKRTRTHLQSRLRVWKTVTVPGDLGLLLPLQRGRSRPEGPGGSISGPQRLHIPKAAKGGLEEHRVASPRGRRGPGPGAGRSVPAGCGCWLQTPQPSRARCAASCHVCGPPTTASPSPPLARALRAASSLSQARARFRVGFGTGFALTFKAMLPGRRGVWRSSEDRPAPDCAHSLVLQMQNTSSRLSTVLNLLEENSSAGC